MKPSFWKSETMAAIPKEHRLLAVALLNYADDEGYFQANEALVRGECFPFDDDSKSVRGGLQELSKIGYIALGTSSEGQRIGRVPNFLEHQRIDKPSPSKLKDKSITWDGSMNTPRAIAESSPPEGKGREGKGRETTLRVVGAFDMFWKTYPNTARKVARASCLKSWDRQKLDPLADQIVARIEALKVSEQWQKGFEPAPLTFLNQRRWEDDAAPRVAPVWAGAK